MSVIVHHLREHDGRQARFHLRVEPDGSGLLLANASNGARLSPSGVVIARALLERGGAEAARAQIVRHFPGVPADRLVADIDRVRGLLDGLTADDGRYPITNLDEHGAPLQRSSLGAPLCADVTVEPGGSARALLRPLWEAGIPQVVLVPTAAAAIAELRALVEHAEDLGLVCGVRTWASLLSDDGLDALAAAGLDHLDLYWAGAAASNPAAVPHDRWYGTGDAARARALFNRAHTRALCPTAVVPLTPETVTAAGAIVDALAELRVGTATVFAIASLEPEPADALAATALPQAAAIYEALGERRGVGVVWAPPVERDPARTWIEQLRAGPRAGGEGTIRVLADGEVRPPSGSARVSARLGREPWAQIWAADAFRRWREAALPRCMTCPGLGSCAAGCPREPGTWARRDEPGGAR